MRGLETRGVSVRSRRRGELERGVDSFDPFHHSASKESAQSAVHLDS